MLSFIGRMFGNGRGNGRNASGKRGRGRGLSVRERKERRRLAFIEDLEQKDPATYREMMLRECGLAREDGRVDMAVVMKVIEYLKQIGLKVVPSKGGTDLDDDSLRSWIKDLAPMFAPMLASAVGNRQQQPEPEPSPPHPTYRVIPPEPPAGLAEPQRSQSEPPPAVALVSRFLISQLDGKSPADAAAWMLAQPQAAGLVGRIKETPDVQILDLFGQLAAEAPDYAGFVAWLKARPDWTIETVHEIRRQCGDNTPPTATSGMGI